MNEMPQGWPTDWLGESLAELGDGSRIRCQILLTDGYTSVHVGNDASIMRQWDGLWPAAKETIQKILSDYGRDSKIQATGNFLQISIPPEPIGPGVNWSIALQKSGGDGVWDATFDGWEIDPGESQPYF